MPVDMCRRSPAGLNPDIMGEIIQALSRGVGLTRHKLATIAELDTRDAQKYIARLERQGLVLVSQTATRTFYYGTPELLKADPYELAGR